MKQVEKMYDVIYSNPRLQELFLKFQIDSWKNLTISDKKKIIEEINEIVSSLYGYKKPDIIWTSKDKSLGSASSFSWKLRMDSKKLIQGVSYDNLDTYFHETRHFFQHRAVENQLTSKEYASEENKEKWKNNFLPGNYFGSDTPYYNYQAVEQDAWSCAMVMVRKVYFMNREKNPSSEDKKEWEEYCRNYKAIITQFISENTMNKSVLKTMEDEFKKMYAEKIKDEREYDIGKKIVSAIKNKYRDISKCSDYQVLLLLSPYCFVNLDNKDKIKILKIYAEGIGLNDIVIKQHNVDSIIIGKKAYYNSDSFTLINNLLSIKYLQIGDDIAKGKMLNIDLSETAKDEMRLNLYEDSKGNKINFISDEENLFLFSLQPYAKYEAEYVLKHFNTIKIIEKKVFNKNHREYKFWEDFYDQEKIYKVATKLMDKPFEEYYLEQLDKYRNNILKITNERR